jgi:type II secretory pathway predicted ATPase ExeA
MNLITMIIRRIIQFKIHTFKIFNLNIKMTIQFTIFLIGDLKIKNKMYRKKIKRINKKIMIKIKMTKKMRRRSLYILKFLYINQ